VSRVRVVLAVLLGIGPLLAQREVLLDPGAEADARCEALATLQADGALDVPSVLAALGDADDDVASAAASIVRHEWFELPPELWEGLDRDAGAARHLLRELAQAPRPAAVAWAETRCAPASGRTADDRCLALAACGQPLRAEHVDVLLQVLAEDAVGDGWRAAVALLPPAIADGLVGRVHALLQDQKIVVGQAVPLFDRMTGNGVRQLLGLANVLPEDAGDDLCTQIAQRDPAAVQERARAMLDGEAPIEPLWLRHAGPLLDRPERRERLLAVLQDASAAPRVQQRAFRALLDARVTDARLVRWVLATDEDRERNLDRLLDAAVDRLPGSLLADLLVGDPVLAQTTVRALPARSELGPEIERVLLRSFEGAVADGHFLRPAALALLQRGSELAVSTLWPQLRSSPQWSDYVDAVSRRHTPFVHQLLLVELETALQDEVPAEVRERQLDDVRLALVAQGDLRQLDLLVAHAPRAVPTFVRRCAHHARPLGRSFALQLLEQLPDVADVDLAGELAAWAATCRDAEVLAHMQRLWESPAATEMAAMLREVALRALVQGPQRAHLVETLRAALAAGPLPDALEPLPFELMATMPEPLTPAAVQLLAELALLPPLTDAQHERDLVTRWPDGRYGFPVLAAVGRRLRGCEPAIAAEGFAKVVATVAADPRRDAVSPQRLLVLWRVLERERPLLRAVGGATAELCLALPAGDQVAAGPAHWLLQHRAAARGDLAGAAAHARAAIAGLLRRPADRGTARLFLGERDPATGNDPWAALAAAPHRYDLLAARAAGDDAAAALAAARVREFAGHDAASRRDLDLPPAKDPIR
jgi:hypothetical protein